MGKLVRGGTKTSGEESNGGAKPRQGGRKVPLDDKELGSSKEKSRSGVIPQRKREDAGGKGLFGRGECAERKPDGSQGRGRPLAWG